MLPFSPTYSTPSKNPLCILCDDAALLEKALRAYQGRPLYEGSLSDAELLPLVEKYGLII